MVRDFVIATCILLVLTVFGMFVAIDAIDKSFGLVLKEISPGKFTVLV